MLNANETKLSTTTIESAQRTFASYKDGVVALLAATETKLGLSLSAAIQLILAAKGRLIVSGMGKSGHIGRKVAATFSSTGCSAFFVHPGEASHGDLGMISPQDVIMVFSWSGETAELRNLISYSRRFRISLIAVTANPESNLAKAADVVIVLPQIREACPHNLAPTTSTMIQLAVGDALAVALLESRGFTPTDFSMFHPAGSLGAMLKFVRDVMHTLQETPLASLGTRMSEAVVEMSAKGYGCVGITNPSGELVGIITDGDLRRHMGSNLLDMSVDAVMTKNPKTILPNQLASEAMNVMNTAKVGALIVVDAQRPVGIIRFHDILRAGIV